MELAVHHQSSRGLTSRCPARQSLPLPQPDTSQRNSAAPRSEIRPLSLVRLVSNQHLPTGGDPAERVANFATHHHLCRRGEPRLLFSALPGGPGLIS